MQRRGRTIAKEKKNNNIKLSLLLSGTKVYILLIRKNEEMDIIILQFLPLVSRNYLVTADAP